MNFPLFYGRVWITTAEARTMTLACLFGLLVCASSQADMLLDDSFEDGNRMNTDLPSESAIYVTPVYDVASSPGALIATMSDSSQRLWTYFTERDPLTLEVGQKLIATIKFVPTFGESAAANTSRGFRVGLFHDPSDSRKESDGGSDSGGSGDPWDDASGYAVMLPLNGSGTPSMNPLQIGKREPGNSSNLLGATMAYTLASSGGAASAQTSGTEYAIVLEVNKVADDEAVVTASLYQGESLLATHSVTDKGGSTFGSSENTNPINDKFDQLFVRLSNAASTAGSVKFTNFSVELTQDDSKASSDEP